MTAPADPAVRSRRGRQLTSATLRLVIVLAVIAGIWYAAALFVRVIGDTVATAKLPFPHEVVIYVATYPVTFLEAGWATGSRALIGFFVGLIVGTLFAVVMVQSKWIESAFIPYVLAMQMIPLIALVPILRAVLRDPDLVRLYVTGYVSFFIVAIAVLRGLKNAAPAAIELMDSINASRWKTLRYLRFPAALPYIFTGLRVAAPLSLIGAILVDFLGARNGLGYLMVAALSIGSSQSEVLWAALLISMAIGLLFTGAVIFVERRVSFWQPAFRAEAAEVA